LSEDEQKEKRERISCTLPPSLIDRADKLVFYLRKEGMNRSLLIEEALEAYVSKAEKKYPDDIKFPSV